MMRLATKEDKKWHIDEWARLFKATTWEELKMIAEKDKVYSEIDVRHAADKVIQANGNNMFFIVGPRGVIDDIIHPSLIEEYALRNFMLHILSFHDFFNIMIPTIPVIDCKEFMQFIFHIAHETKFKEDVILYLDNLAKKHFDLHRR